MATITKLFQAKVSTSNLPVLSYLAIGVVPVPYSSSAQHSTGNKAIDCLLIYRYSLLCLVNYWYLGPTK